MAQTSGCMVQEKFGKTPKDVVKMDSNEATDFLIDIVEPLDVRTMAETRLFFS